jgi:aspartate 1-decarboxylase
MGLLMEAADLIEGEQVQVVDITNGARLTTYVIAGRRGSGVIGINGATAHLIHPGDLTIIMAFQQVPESAVAEYVPAVVHVDAHNRMVALDADPAQPVPGSAHQITGR